MTLPLTPDILRAAYDYLNECSPFQKWNLPPGEDVIFRVARSPNMLGWYHLEDGKHAITISTACIGATDSLMRVMGHEMIHLHEQNAKACGRGQHSAAFNRWAAQVCRIHGFDPKLF